MVNNTNKEFWYWIELIGFDHSASDFGTAEFLGRLAQKPTGISLLFSDIDFVNLHDSSKRGIPLRPCDCSYGGHRQSEERERQEWTGTQLVGLVSALKKQGIKVVFSLFNFFVYIGDDKRAVYGDFISRNPELRDIAPDGTKGLSVNVLKRFADGRFYEDYLFQKIKEVIDCYGFDGLQLADGLSSSRPSLENSDFSDDTVSQFFEWGKAENGNTFIEKMLSVGVLPTVGSEDGYRQRRDIILDDFRYEFTVFLTERWRRFYAKLHDRLVCAGHTVIVNSTWTRGPFEALYRYGLDYAKAFEKGGFYGIMIEDVSATRAIMSDEDQGGFHLNPEERRYCVYEYDLMQSEIKTYLPKVKQLTMSSVKDTQEQWDVLRHAPTALERAILRRSNCPVLTENGYANTSEGAWYCLSDSMRQADWEIISEKEGVANSGDSVSGFSGAVFLFSETLLYPQLNRYIEKRAYSSNLIYTALTTAGLTVGGSATTEGLARHPKKMSVIAVDPGLMTAAEQDALAACGGAVVSIGVRAEKLGRPAFEANYGLYDVCFYGTVFSEGALQELHAALSANAQKIRCDSFSNSEDRGIWTQPLQYERHTTRFMRMLADFINKACALPHTLPTEYECKLTAFWLKSGVLRLLITSDENTYALPKIEVGLPIVSARSRTKYRGYEIPYEGSVFSVRVPPKGMEIVDIEVRQ
ncbi:MAG: hypothetical protein LBH18_02315 [Spirochaetaceae bacterium]|jgi:hypothetical protein|nr:hypothetical protein [Spirochaetaceae bacterium]